MGILLWYTFFFLFFFLLFWYVEPLISQRQLHCYNGSTKHTRTYNTVDGNKDVLNSTQFYYLVSRLPHSGVNSPIHILSFNYVRWELAKSRTWVLYRYSCLVLKLPLKVWCPMANTFKTYEPLHSKSFSPQALWTVYLGLYQWWKSSFHQGATMGHCVEVQLGLTGALSLTPWQESSLITHGMLMRLPSVWRKVTRCHQTRHHGMPAVGLPHQAVRLVLSLGLGDS